jgi:hypothetical protein
VLAFAMAACGSAETDRGSHELLRGEVHSAEGAISLETEDWTYAVPIDGVAWIDQANTWHEDGRPECLPPVDPPPVVTFAAVEVTIEERTWRPVVWVDCRE